jgi:hypothetical protein
MLARDGDTRISLLQSSNPEKSSDPFPILFNTDHNKKNSLSLTSRREMVRQGMTRKKECEAKAVEILHRLVLADSVQREWFRDAVSRKNTHKI